MHPVLLDLGFFKIHFYGFFMAVGFFCAILLARQLAKEIFALTKTFPKEEKYSLISQIRKSSRSVGAQIAEAWAKRKYEAHFISKLTDADGEQQETQHWIDTSLDCGYIDISKKRELIGRYKEIGRMLNGMIRKSSRFCGQILKEGGELYQFEPADQ